MMKRFLGNILIGLVSVGVTLVAFEIAFRMLMPKPGTEKKEWNDRPPFYYLHEQSADFRDLPYLPDKPKEVFRIAMVGDSFAFGPYLQVDDTFSKRLERMLNMNGGQQKVEVINYGVPRYSTYHEIALVEKAIREKADLVILQITLNDPEIKPYRPTSLIGGVVDRFGGVHYEKGLFAHWKSAAFVATRIYNWQSKNKYVDYFFRLYNRPKPWGQFSQSVRKIYRETKEAKIPLVAVVFPLFGLPLDETYPFHPLHEKIQELLKSEGIAQTDLFNAYAGIPLDRIQVIVHKDFHPNEIGHRIAAEKMYEFLESSRLIPESSRIRRKYPERIGIKLPAENLANK